MDAIKTFEKNFTNTDYFNINYELKPTSWFYRIIYNLSHFNDDQRLLSIGNLFVKLLDKFETDQTAYNELKNVENFTTLKTLQKDVTRLFEGIGHPAGVEYESSKKVAEDIRYKIAWRLHALDRKLNGNIKEKEQDIPESLSEWIEEWRSDNKTILQDGSSLFRTEASVDERINKIKEELKKHPSFVSILVEHPKLAELMMDWALRDRLPLDLFIQMPTGFKWIKRLFLASRITKFIETKELMNSQVEAYSIQDGENGFKKLHLPFEGKQIYIHSDANTEIKLGKEGRQYETTLKKIKHIFENKGVIAGDVEFLPGIGFTNFNCYKLGWRIGSDNEHIATKKSFYEFLFTV